VRVYMYLGVINFLLMFSCCNIYFRNSYTTYRSKSPFCQ